MSAAPPTAVVVALHGAVDQARSTVRSTLAAGGVTCRVVDVDGDYRPVGSEDVLALADLARSAGAAEEAMVATATLSPDELSFYVGVLAACDALAGGAPGVVLIAAGVVVLGDLGALVAAAGDTTAVLPRLDDSALGHSLTKAPVTHATEFGEVVVPRPTTTLFTRSLLAFGPSAELDVLRGLAAEWRRALGALDAFVASTPSTVVRDDAVLVGAWRGSRDSRFEEGTDGVLRLDGAAITALDLTAFDPEKPWILEPSDVVRPEVLVSEHPALLATLRQVAGERLEDAPSPASRTTPARLLFDGVLRQEARRAHLIGGDIPDLVGTVSTRATREDVERWALDLLPAAHPRPVARYLIGVRGARRDLQHRMPHVPGVDSAQLAEWALERGVNLTQFDPDLMRRAAEATLAAQPAEARRGARPEGVNLVGYLSAELGLGQSGRLVDQALHAAGEPTSTFDVSRRLPHRQDATYRVSEPVLYDTTLLCVNGAETRDVIRQVGDVARGGSRRVGMWYWELEEFPETHARGFRFVDEVWAATDFIRDAVAAKSPGVPVRTVLPPLPQREGDAPALPTRFGLSPERPFFLFTFDFMSYAGRKNPLGLVDAFVKAFPEATAGGPQLVIKTINGDKRSTEAERLRLRMATREDLVLIEEYLPNHERHVLVAHCAAYVSLHKAEGLGLTLAEAMAWGKPVISTRYGGVVQFMDDENSFLVDWTPGTIPEQMGPYEEGLRWAEPDLDQAAALMRLVIEQPERARAIGDRAAHDIRELHNVGVAGARMRAALTEGRAARAAKQEARRAAEAAAVRTRSLRRRVASRARRELRRLRTPAADR